MTLPPLGIIEGYYGEPWSEAARNHVVATLAPHGYSFFIHAPKADEFLRRRWREPYPAENEAMLIRLAAQCRAQGVRFGVGLSPYELYRGFDDDARAALKARLAMLDRVGAEILAILFDDMRGDVEGLAAAQADIMHWIAANSAASQVIFCPTYYTDDFLLDRVFGARPQGYLEDLGRLLDPSIAVFWTGEEVCAREISPGHLARVGEQLRRKPFLWDNYPVNDGPRMSQFLHLRAFTGRPASNAAHVAGHAINPALQPTLSLIPALTLVELYEKGDAYEYGRAFLRAAETVLGRELARAVANDFITLADSGLPRLEGRLPKLKARYAAFDHDAAREILRFLDGDYRFAGEMN